MHQANITFTVDRKKEFDHVISDFKKKVSRLKILSEWRDKQTFVSPSEKRRKKKIRAKKRQEYYDREQQSPNHGVQHSSVRNLNPKLRKGEKGAGRGPKRDQKGRLGQGSQIWDVVD